MPVNESVILIVCLGLAAWSGISACLLSTGRVQPSRWYGYSVSAVSLMGLGMLGLVVLDLPAFTMWLGPTAAPVLGAVGPAVFLAGLLLNSRARRRLLDGAREDPPTSLNL